MSQKNLFYAALAAATVFLIALKAVGMVFQMGLLSTAVLVAFAFLYALAIVGFYAGGQWKESPTLRLVGHILTLLGVFVGWSYLGPLWSRTLVIHAEMGGWGVPLFYVGVLFGGPVALGLWLTIVLKKPPKVAIAYAILTLVVVATGCYQGFRQSGLRAPLSREPIFALCPGSAKVNPKSGELPWETTHFVSRVALRKGCLFHVGVHSKAIQAYDEDADSHRLLAEYLEGVVGLRIGDSNREVAAKRARATVESRTWLRANAPGVEVAGDDDSADDPGEAGGFVHSQLPEDPAEMASAIPRRVLAVLVIVVFGIGLGVPINSWFGGRWSDVVGPVCGVLLAAGLTVVLGHFAYGSAWWAFAVRKGDVVEEDRLHERQVVYLGWQDYSAADTSRQWWVAYLGDPDCTPVLEERGVCTQEVCLHVQHGALGYRWVVPAEVTELEQQCFRPGDLGRLTSSGDGKGVMSVRVYSGGGKVIFGEPEWLRRRLQQRHDDARARKVKRVGGLAVALVRARCISGMHDRSGDFPELCGRNYRPLHNP